MRLTCIKWQFLSCSLTLRSRPWWWSSMTKEWRWESLCVGALFWQQWSIRLLVVPVIKVDILTFSCVLFLAAHQWYGASLFLRRMLSPWSMQVWHFNMLIWGDKTRLLELFLQKEGIKVLHLFLLSLSWHSNNFCRNIQAPDEEIFSAAKKQGCRVWSN